MKDSAQHAERQKTTRDRPREDDPEQTRPMAYFGMALAGLIFLLVVISVSLW